MPWSGGDEIEIVVRAIDGERFALLTRNADRIRELYTAFGEDAEFHSSDVIRIYNALGATSDVPSSGSLSNYLANDERGGLLEKLGSGVWRVLRVAPSAPALDIKRLVESIDAERFGALPTQAARIRAIYAAFGKGTEFRLYDLVRACQTLGYDVDARGQSSIVTRLRYDTSKGRLEAVRRGVWRVLHIEELPTRLDVEHLVQDIDPERFASLPTQTARIRAIYAAFGEGTAFRRDDVMRAYKALDYSADALSESSVSGWLHNDVSRGWLESVKRSVWRVLRAGALPPQLDIERLVQAIDVERFASRPTQAARVRAIWSAFGVGAEFRSDDVVRVYDALGSGFDAPNSRFLSSYLTKDTKGGLLEKLGVKTWRVLRLEPEVQALDIEDLIQHIEVERFESLPTLAARVREICRAFGEGTEFRRDDVVRAYEVLGLSVDARCKSSFSTQLHNDASHGRLEVVRRGVWRVPRAEQKLEAPETQLDASDDVPRLEPTPRRTKPRRAKKPKRRVRSKAKPAVEEPVIDEPSIEEFGLAEYLIPDY